MDESDDVSYVNEEASPSGESTGGASPLWILTSVELDVAYSSEKALNLEMLFMQVEEKAGDYDALDLENEDVSYETLQQALEFNLLSGILNSEVKELESFIASLQTIIVDVGQNLAQSVDSEVFSAEIEGKLHKAEDSLKHSHDIVADIKTRSAKYEKDLATGEHQTGSVVDGETGSSQLSPTNAKRKQMNMEEQRNFLQMLEKSLAREMDLEKKLSDVRSDEEELKLKVGYAEQEICNLEDYTEVILERMFESELAAELFLRISKELTEKLEKAQIDLNNSLLRESEMRFKLEENSKNSSGSSLTITGAKYQNLPMMQVNSLEKELRESDVQLQLTKASSDESEEQPSTSQPDHSETENVIRGLGEDISRLERELKSAEAKCTQLTKLNLELSEQLGLLDDNGTTKKAHFLEKKLKESDTQLEHAKASVEAIEEQQSMLYSALNDMEHVIEDLKGKVSKAESRAESAESKCKLLTETNLELSEEMGFLRNKLECLEASLTQADDSKMATAKDIAMRTKYIADLVMKLALERERLQLQIRVLTEKNKILSKKCINTKARDYVDTTHKQTESERESIIHKSPEDTLRESSTAEVEESVTVVSACEKSSVNRSTEISADAESNIETVRTIEATQLNLKALAMTFIVVLVSVLAFYIFQQQEAKSVV